MSKSVYKRIVLKLSGEALQGKNTHGIDQPVLISIARQIKEIRDMHVDVAIVLGAGTNGSPRPRRVLVPVFVVAAPPFPN